MDNLLLTPEGATWLGAWVGLGMALLVFSAILGDHWAARLGQYILVGAGLGYAAAASWQALRTLPLIDELRQEPIGHWWHWIGVALAVLLMLAALERIFAQGAGGPPPPGWRRWLLRLGAVPTTLLLALGVGVAVIGVIQGTLAPQLLFAAQTGLQLDASLDLFLTGALTLVLTISSIFFFAVDPERHLIDQPTFVRRVVNGIIWIGQRGVWLAAGIIFARLAASRASLLIAQLDYFRNVFVASGLWQNLEAWWRGFGF